MAVPMSATNSEGIAAPTGSVPCDLGVMRIVRRRTKGWTLASATRNPKGAAVVDRTSRWGNPFAVRAAGGRWTIVDVRTGAHLSSWPTRTEAHTGAVELFRQHLAEHDDLVEAARARLVGLDLACFCAADMPCHATVWLEVVNMPPDSAF
jgi:hypothetical protein